MEVVGGVILSYKCSYTTFRSCCSLHLSRFTYSLAYLFLLSLIEVVLEILQFLLINVIYTPLPHLLFLPIFGYSIPPTFLIP